MSKKNISGKSAAEAQAERHAAFEGEVPELDRSFFEGAQIRIGRVVLREATGTYTKRGRPPQGSGPKVQQSLRLSPEVLEFFKAGGRGWQARIDEVLRRHVKMVIDMKRQVAEAEQAEPRVAEERSPYEAGEGGGRDGG